MECIVNIAADERASEAKGLASRAGAPVAPVCPVRLAGRLDPSRQSYLAGRWRQLRLLPSHLGPVRQSRHCSRSRLANRCSGIAGYALRPVTPCDPGRTCCARNSRVAGGTLRSGCAGGTSSTCCAIPASCAGAAGYARGTSCAGVRRFRRWNLCCHSSRLRQLPPIRASHPARTRRLR